MSSHSEITIAAETAHIQDLLALVKQGQDVIISQASQPVAKLVAIHVPKHARIFGSYAGKISMRDDFGDPLPEDYWLTNDSE